MHEQDEPNKLYIGNLVNGSEFLGFLAMHRTATQIVLTLLALIVNLELFASVLTTRNFFNQETMSYNPIRILLGSGEHPIGLLLVLMLSLMTGAVLTMFLTKERKAKYEKNSRGDIVATAGQEGRGNIASEQEIGTFLSRVSAPDVRGIIVGEELETGAILIKEWERTDFVNQLANNNVLLAGPSGAGKTSSFILPNILSHLDAGHALIIFDPKGDIYTDTAPVAKYLGYEHIYILNLRADELTFSDGWDVVKPIREADNAELAASDFANCILRNLGSAKKDFWNSSNENLLSLVLLFVASANGFIPLTVPTKRGSDGSVIAPADHERVFREVVAYIESPETLKANVAAAIDRDPMGDGRLLKGRYNTWAGNKEWQQIASGLSTALSTFRTKQVAEILSQDDIDVRRFAEEKSVIYVIPPTLSDTFKPITSLFFMSAIDTLVSAAFKKPLNKLDRMVYLMMEEFASIGEIPRIKEALNTVRSYNIAMMLCVQQVADIKGIYADMNNNEAYKVIFENCDLQICMGGTYHQGTELSNATYFSSKSGMQTIHEKSEMEQRSKLFPDKIQEYTVLEKRQMGRDRGIAVYMPDDILRLKKNEMLVFAASHNPFLCNKFFWERHPLSNIKLRDRRTHEIHHLKTCDHIPAYKNPTGELFDPAVYELIDKRLIRSAQGRESSGISAAEYLRG